MQDIHLRFERNMLTTTQKNIINNQSAITPNVETLKQHFNLFQQNLTETIGNTKSIDNLIKSSTTSSEDDNSPTELNNCRRLVEKPPLVKRLTMGILRQNEDSRPLVHNKSASLTSSDSIHTISDGYVNEAICDSEKFISNKFGDSCNQSFHQTNIPMVQLSSSNNAIPLSPKNLPGVGGKLLQTCVEVHAAEQTSNNCNINNSCYNNATPTYNETNFNDLDYKKNFINNSGVSNTKATPPILPLRNDALSLVEQTELKGAPWFQAGLPREISLEILSRQNPGAFLVRQSTSKAGCFALSLRVPPPAPKVAHYLILRTERGYKIKGFTKEFSSLRALITHHSVMKELLPVPLALPRPHDLLKKKDMDDLDNFWFIK